MRQQARSIDVGPGFVRARECPDCGHTKCGESCVCNCDAAHAEYAAAMLLSALDEANKKVRHLEEALRDAEKDLSDSAFKAHVERYDPWGSK